MATARWCGEAEAIVFEGGESRGNTVSSHGDRCVRLVGHAEGLAPDVSGRDVELLLVELYKHGEYRREDARDRLRYGAVAIGIAENEELDSLQAFISAGEARRVARLLEHAADVLDGVVEPLSRRA